MNKKGFVFGLVIAIAIGLVITIGGIALITGLFTSKSFVILLTGILVVALTLIYVIPKAIQGNLTRQKIGFLLLILFTGITIIFISQTSLIGQSGLGTEIYYPQYGHLDCNLGRADYNLLEKIGLTTPQIITCGVGMNGYTDKCNFKMQIRGTNWYSIFSGVKFEKCNNNNECTLVTGASPIQGDYFQVAEVDLDSNNDGYIDTQDSNVYSTIKITPGSGLFTSTTYDIKVVGNAYYLKDTQGNNYVSSYPEGCNLLTIKNNLQQTNGHIASVVDSSNSQTSKFNYQQSANQIPFGGTVNYVWGLTKGITSNVIQHNGQNVYIEKTGFYDPIKTTDDGYNYVDWQHPISDPSIQCVPSNVFLCNADATLRSNPSQNVDGQSCSLVRGVNPNDFFKISETQCARFNCVNGVIQTSEKQTCAVCGQGYIYNSQNNKCVKVGDTGTGTIEHDQCNQKASQNPLLGYEWVTVTSEPSLFEKIITLGQAKSTTTGYCKATFLIYYIFGAIAIIFIIVIILLLKPSKKRKRK